MRHRGIEAKLVLMAFFMLILGGCEGHLERFEFTRLEMGVRTRILTYARSKVEAEAGAAAAFARIAELDACMSDYRADSELMRLCAAPAGTAVPISEDLFEVLSTAGRVSQGTDGAFDVTVGPAVALWRRARATHELPTRQEIDASLASMGWRNVVLDSSARTATLLKPGMKLDLGGIAKGYAAQRGVEVLSALGQKRCLVALAGDIAAGKPPPWRDGWSIELEPAGHSTALLEHGSISTSGDEAQFVEISGRRYSHIIDPRTGMAVEGPMWATVWGQRGDEVDALATALCVLRRTPQDMHRRFKAIGGAWLEAQPRVLIEGVPVQEHVGSGPGETGPR